jgi:hypothetical protein
VPEAASPDDPNQPPPPDMIRNDSLGKRLKNLSDEGAEGLGEVTLHG